MGGKGFYIELLGGHRAGIFSTWAIGPQGDHRFRIDRSWSEGYRKISHILEEFYPRIPSFPQRDGKDGHELRQCRFILGVWRWRFRMGRRLATKAFSSSLDPWVFRQVPILLSRCIPYESFRTHLKEVIPTHLTGEGEDWTSGRSRRDHSGRRFSGFHLGDFTYFMPYLIEIRNRVAASLFHYRGDPFYRWVFMTRDIWSYSWPGLLPLMNRCSSSCPSRRWRKALWVQKQLKERTGRD